MQQNPNGTWLSMMQDGLGSVRGVYSGGVISTQEYSPYGVPLDTMAETDFGFTGEVTDNNGLVYLRARYLNPGMGVFSGCDPYEGDNELPLTLNGYNWVEGNAINRIDPGGQFSVADVYTAVGAALVTLSAQTTRCKTEASRSAAIHNAVTGEVTPIAGRLEPALQTLAASLQARPYRSMSISHRVDRPEQQEGVFEKDGGGWSGWAGVVAAGFAAFVAHAGLTAADLRGGSAITDVVTIPQRTNIPLVPGSYAPPSPQPKSSPWPSTEEFIPARTNSREEELERVIPIPLLDLPENKKPVTCVAKCQLIPIGRATCSEWSSGTATAVSEDLACRAAKRVATQASPRNCYPRHCSCRCSE